MNKILYTFALSMFMFSSCFSAVPEKGTKTESTGPGIVHLTNDSFKKLVYNYDVNKEWKYEGTMPALIDFYADWCGPCKQLAPVIDQLAKEYNGKILVYKVDTDAQKQLASYFGISSIPTLLFIPVKGQPQAAMGALPKETLVKIINEVMLSQNNNLIK